MRIRSRFALVGFVVAAALVGAPGVLSDGNGVGPQQSCPSDEAGWFITPPSPGDAVVDRNGDNLICVKSVSGRGSSRDVPGFSVMDDLIIVP